MRIADATGYLAGSMFVMTRLDFQHGDTAVRADIRQGAIDRLNKLGTPQLPASAKTIQKMKKALAEDGVTLGRLRELQEELRGRLVDEMESALFLSVAPDKAPFYLDGAQFGSGVADKFRSAVFDIEEAGKCLALSRATACVFHLMRVVEVGLRALAQSLNDPKLVPATNPTWGRFLARCKTELEKAKPNRSPEWREDDEFYSGAYAHLLGVKVAWRNPTMHIGKKYTEEEALDIWNHVRVLMTHLATKLGE